MQSALSAVKNVRSHSNLIPTDQSIVEIVGQKEDEQVVSVTRRLRERTFPTVLFSTFFKQQKLSSSAFSGLVCQKLQFQLDQLLHG